MKKKNKKKKTKKRKTEKTKKINKTNHRGSRESNMEALSPCTRRIRNKEGSTEQPSGSYGHGIIKISDTIVPNDIKRHDQIIDTQIEINSDTPLTANSPTIIIVQTDTLGQIFPTSISVRATCYMGRYFAGHIHRGAGLYLGFS
jgi:hypothetical protein